MPSVPWLCSGFPPHHTHRENSCLFVATKRPTCIFNSPNHRRADILRGVHPGFGILTRVDLWRARGSGGQHVHA
jgi:hypothetical protein